MKSSLEQQKINPLNKTDDNNNNNNKTKKKTKMKKKKKRLNMMINNTILYIAINKLTVLFSPVLLLQVSCDHTYNVNDNTPFLQFTQQ